MEYIQNMILLAKYFIKKNTKMESKMENIFKLIIIFLVFILLKKNLKMEKNMASK